MRPTPSKKTMKYAVVVLLFTLVIPSYKKLEAAAVHKQQLVAQKSVVQKQKKETVPPQVKSISVISTTPAKKAATTFGGALLSAVERAASYTYSYIATSTTLIVDPGGQTIKAPTGAGSATRPSLSSSTPISPGGTHRGARNGEATTTAWSPANDATSTENVQSQGSTANATAPVLLPPPYASSTVGTDDVTATTSGGFDTIGSTTSEPIIPAPPILMSTHDRATGTDATKLVRPVGAATSTITSTMSSGSDSTKTGEPTVSGAVLGIDSTANVYEIDRLSRDTTRMLVSFGAVVGFVGVVLARGRRQDPRNKAAWTNFGTVGIDSVGELKQRTYGNN